MDKMSPRPHEPNPMPAPPTTLPEPAPPATLEEVEPKPKSKSLTVLASLGAALALLATLFAYDGTLPNFADGVQFEDVTLTLALVLWVLTQIGHRRAKQPLK